MRKRIHIAIQQAGDIVTRLVHATLFFLGSTWGPQSASAWIAQLETAPLEEQLTLGSSVDFFHVHVLLRCDAATVTRVRDIQIYLNGSVGQIGRAHVVRCGPTGHSGLALEAYLSKWDAAADNLVEKAYPGSSSRTFFSSQPPLDVASRLVPCASWQLSKLVNDNPDIFHDPRFARQDSSAFAIHSSAVVSQCTLTH